MPTAQNLLTKFLHHIPQFAWDAIAHLCNDLFWHTAVVRLGYGPGDGCQGVGVSTQGDGLADGILEVF